MSRSEEEEEELVPLRRVLDAVRLGLLSLWNNEDEKNEWENRWDESRDSLFEGIVRRRRKSAINLLEAVADILDRSVSASDDRLAFFREVDAAEDLEREQEINRCLKQERDQTRLILSELRLMAEV